MHQFFQWLAMKHRPIDIDRLYKRTNEDAIFLLNIRDFPSSHVSVRLCKISKGPYESIQNFQWPSPIFFG